jgi:hypothetical protein
MQRRALETEQKRVPVSFGQLEARNFNRKTAGQVEVASEMGLSGGRDGRRSIDLAFSGVPDPQDRARDGFHQP